ncbi:hypothetical protein [Acidithiobacillus albertensis]|uniref:hypothetical protein n=1 Tax=Acidithiobacillus albertensis TaxID=119978 RepID=UPI00094AD6D2|nr:hypothetical protein [Acidithiobacillus albertensis]
MQAITRCKNEEKMKADMKDRKEYYESCKDWAAGMMAKEGFSKEDCKNELLSLAETEKEKAYNSPYESKEMTALVGFVAILVALALGIFAKRIPNNDIIWYVLICIGSPLLVLFVWLRIYLPIEIKKKIDTKERIFNLEKAAEYIEKNIP